MKIFKKLFRLLSKAEQKKALILLGLIFVTTLIDLVGIASIMPFIAVLGNPELVETNEFLNWAYHFTKDFGVKNVTDFLFFLGIIVFLLLLISLIFKSATTYMQLRFTLMREYSIGKKLIENHLKQTYSWFLDQNSSNISKKIFSEVSQVIDRGLSPMMTLITQGTVIIGIITLLIFIDLNLVIIIGSTLVLFYLLIFKKINNYLNKIGGERSELNEKRFKAISEVFGAIKEVKLGGIEKLYVDQFSILSYEYAKNQSSSQIISQLPRFGLEAIAFGGIIIIMLVLMKQGKNFVDVMPIIALYAFAGYRLMPALQQVYSASTQLKYAEASINALYNDIFSCDLKNLRENKTNKLKLTKKISLNGINYCYPNSSKIILEDISLEIKAKSKVGIIGCTGSGKTTLVDIILGLLETQKGTLKIDGSIINDKNLRCWQNSIGYVPQQIYLSDDTIAANIAFGSDPLDVDNSIVEHVSKLANLHKFVINELPEKYNTNVGERGVKLSGGQRQRIGIARALYKNPQVLILDEATSALDNSTEKIVMDAINNFSKDLTIIIIAHRLGTLKGCDVIFLLDKGKLVNKGNFKKIVKQEPYFKINTN
jgi:ABC-type bacteriocin/lantibiotic exporter with double-glycine peptidase domain